MISSYCGDTHIYQERSTSPPCMVFPRSKQQEESPFVCFLSMDGSCKALDHTALLEPPKDHEVLSDSCSEDKQCSYN